MGVCVNTGVDSQSNTLDGVLSACGCGNALDFNLAVDNDRADAGADCATNLAQRLVVAVQTDSCSWDATGKCRSQLATARNVDVQP